MLAVVVREFGPLTQHRVENIPAPKPGPHDVLIETKACDVNYPDFLVMTGAYQVKPPLPFSPGKSAAGIILTVGDQVNTFKPGDRVAAQVEYGAHAEQFITPAVNCHPIPDSLPFEQAAAIGLAYPTAYFALFDRAQFQPGARVLINGAAGGVGLATLHLVKALGGIALAGVRKPEHKDFVRQQSADHVIDLSAENLRDGLRDQVKAATAGHGADIVIDPVGGAVFEASLRALAWRGSLVVIGFAAGQIPTVKANYLLLKNIAVSGLQWSDYRDREPAWVERAQEEIYRLYQEGLFRPHVMQTFPLEQFGTALEVVAQGRVMGKVVLIP